MTRPGFEPISLNPLISQNGIPTKYAISRIFNLSSQVTASTADIIQCSPHQLSDHALPARYSESGPWALGISGEKAVYNRKWGPYLDEDQRWRRRRTAESRCDRDPRCTASSRISASATCWSATGTRVALALADPVISLKNGRNSRLHTDSNKASCSKIEASLHITF